MTDQHGDVAEPRARTHVLEIGGQSKAEILSSLREHAVHLNHYANMLFDDPAFVTNEDVQRVVAAETTVAELGFVEGATSAEIFSKAASIGLALCPLELAPRLRLHLTDQAEGPYLTVASRKIRDDDAYPNGFYLRRIDGKLWLRGYRAAEEHLWEPACAFVFLVA